MYATVFLLGIISSTVPKNNLAVFNIEPKLFRVGDQIEDYSIVQIDSQEVYLLKDSRIFYLRPGDGLGDIAEPILEKTDTKVVMPLSYREYLAGDGFLPTLMHAGTEYTFSEYFGISGYRIFSINEGSVFDLIGLENGDIIFEIAGVRLDSLGKTVKVLQSLRNADDVSFKFIREDKIIERNVVIR